MNSMGDLYLQYEHCLRVQRRVILRSRQRLQQALRAADAKEAERLNRVLRVLYEEKSELEERTQGLKAYLRQ